MIGKVLGKLLPYLILHRTGKPTKLFWLPLLIMRHAFGRPLYALHVSMAREEALETKGVYRCQT